MRAAHAVRGLGPASIAASALRCALMIGLCAPASAAGDDDGRRPLHASLSVWFEASERYALQLHELERAGHLGMKVRDVLRQQTVVCPPVAG